MSPSTATTVICVLSLHDERPALALWGSAFVLSKLLAASVD